MSSWFLPGRPCGEGAVPALCGQRASQWSHGGGEGWKATGNAALMLANRTDQPETQTLKENYSVIKEILAIPSKRKERVKT